MTTLSTGWHFSGPTEASEPTGETEPTREDDASDEPAAARPRSASRSDEFIIISAVFCASPSAVPHEAQARPEARPKPARAHRLAGLARDDVAVLMAVLG